MSGDVVLDQARLRGAETFASAVRCRGHRSRQRTAAFGGRRRRRPGRPAPALGAMVQRHDPDRTVRRGPHGRRRFRVARRRNQFRRGAGAGRDRVARRDLEHRRPLERLAQDRPAAGAQRTERRAPDPARADLLARARSRTGARAALRARHRQSVADGHRSLRQYSRRSIRKSCSPTRVTGDDQTPAAEPDAEVSFVTCDLSAPPPVRGKAAPRRRR